MATCHACGKVFESQRSTAKFCSDACRKRASREQKMDVPGVGEENVTVTPLSPAEEVKISASLMTAADLEARQMDRGVVPNPLLPMQKGDPALLGVHVPDTQVDPWLKDPKKTLVGAETKVKIMHARMEKGLPAHTTTWTKEAYVAHEVKVTKSQIDRGLLPSHGGARLKHCAE